MRRAALLLLVAAVVAAAAHLGLFNIPRLARGVGNLSQFMGDLFPPNFNVAGPVLAALVETVEMSLVATVVGFVAAVPLALLGARNLFGRAVGAPARFVLAAVRTIPALLWAIIMVVAFGLGPVPGTLGLAAYTVGYLGKLMYEAFEAVDPEVLEAVRGVGCSRLQLIRHAVLPEAGSPLVSQVLFMFEYNVRASSILGFVGAGGVGFYMFAYIELFQYRSLMTVIILTLALVLAIDFASGLIRRQFLVGEARPGSPNAGFLAGIWDAGRGVGRRFRGAPPPP